MVVEITSPGGKVQIGGIVTGGTSGSVVYIDSSSQLAQDNSDLFWDATAKRLGIDNNTPSSQIDINTLLPTNVGLSVQGHDIPLAGALPTTLSGLQLWVKGDSITPVADGTQFGTWPDSSGNGRDLTQSTGANQPKYYSTAGPNSLPIVRFTASDSSRLASVPFTLNQPIEIFIVLKDNGTSSGFEFHDGNSNDSLVAYYPGGVYRLYAGANGPVMGAGLGTTNFHLLTEKFNGASSELWDAGVSQATGDVGGNNAGGFTIGSRHDGAAPCSFDCAEIVIYNRVLTTTEREMIEKYLGDKYSITVPTIIQSQSANLQEWKNNAGTVTSVVNPDGKLGLGITNPTYSVDITKSSDYDNMIRIAKSDLSNGIQVTVNNSDATFIEHVSSGANKRIVFQADGGLQISSSTQSMNFYPGGGTGSANALYSSSNVNLEIGNGIGTGGSTILYTARTSVESSGTKVFHKFTGESNQSGTAGYNGIQLNITETALGSGANNLMDLQIGGSSKVTIDNAGTITIATAGAGIKIKEGSNATMGTATLSTGAATVSTTKVTANSRIFLTNNANGGIVGSLYVSAVSAGTSFTITSTNVADTSTIAWLIVEPA